MEKPLITYYFKGSGDHLIDTESIKGKHPGEAIAHAKKALSEKAKSSHDFIQVFSGDAAKRKLLGKALFRASGTPDQCIDWLPARAPGFRVHSGEIRARGINSAARRSVSYKSKK